MKKSRADKDLAAFGKRIAVLRRECDLTQEELASKTDLATRTIASIEQGKRWARITTLHKLSKGLGVSTSDLFKDLK